MNFSDTHLQRKKENYDKQTQGEIICNIPL